RDADLVPGDDFGMMREVMRRRFSRLVKEYPGGPEAEEVPDEGFPSWPDLVLVDGGRGQLNAVLETVRELGVRGVAFVGVSKGPERNAGNEVFHLADGRTLHLDRRSPVLYYLQRLRDEAHRFAIGSHRVRRSREARGNPLDAIPGIGAARKRALLAAFGSARAVARAEVSELAAVEGISLKLAQLIHDHFR
ncbi:MAG TPA: excinuclease ABC subunit C, partial [Bryobacterales bacterium]|nr:excinuclease ABC subunit C [Bryobacterales bacterium]